MRVEWFSVACRCEHISAKNVFVLPVVIDLLVAFSFRARTRKKEITCNFICAADAAAVAAFTAIGATFIDVQWNYTRGKQEELFPFLVFVRKMGKNSLTSPFERRTE